MTATVGRLLAEATERLATSPSESPRLDAELLLGHVLSVDRTGVLAHPEAMVGVGPARAFGVLVARRAAGEPVAYIRGVKEFYGLALAVDRRVLIPRPDTELLVDLARDAVRERLTATPRPAGSPPLRVWDVATGSGAVAVALAVSLRRSGFLDEVSLLMSDVSPEALAVALENAVAHGVADRVAVATGDLLDVHPPPDLPVDVLTSNLPYVPSAAVPNLPAAASFEPVLALDGGPDGLALVRRLLADLSRVMAPGGRAILEIGADQADAAPSAARDRLPSWAVGVVPDLSGQPRALTLTAPAAGARPA